MNRVRNDFEVLVDRALHDSNVSHMRNVIEKELLIYDTLFCLEHQGLLDNIIFQGGSLLRFGYGGERLSEDLDFVAGKNFSLSHFDSMKSCIESFISNRYGLAVVVKQSGIKGRGQEGKFPKVYRWHISVTTHPDKKDLPKQRVKIEIATVPAYTREIVAIRTIYDFLPDGYDDILVSSETLDEVMADKLVSFPATTQYIRYRDIWDLYWLVKRRAAIDVNLVERKIVDYRLTGFEGLLTETIERLPQTVNSPEFRNEMRQLLPTDAFNRTLDKEKFSEHLLRTLQSLFGQVRDELNIPRQMPSLGFHGKVATDSTAK